MLEHGSNPADFVILLYCYIVAQLNLGEMCFSQFTEKEMHHQVSLILSLSVIMDILNFNFVVNDCYTLYLSKY